MSRWRVHESNWSTRSGTCFRTVPFSSWTSHLNEFVVWRCRRRASSTTCSHKYKYLLGLLFPRSTKSLRKFVRSSPSCIWFVRSHSYLTNTNIIFISHEYLSVTIVGVMTIQQSTAIKSNYTIIHVPLFIMRLFMSSLLLFLAMLFFAHQLVPGALRQAIGAKGPAWHLSLVSYANDSFLRIP